MFPPRGGDNSSDNSGKKERVQEQKDKMQTELQALWTEQFDQMKKKKEQCATEVSQLQLTQSSVQLFVPNGPFYTNVNVWYH